MANSINKLRKMNTKYSSGGRIKNQYGTSEGREVWGKWNKGQRMHFLSDHFSGASRPFPNTKEENDKIASQKWSDLHPAVQEAVSKHVKEGQYAKGGSAAPGSSKAKSLIEKYKGNIKSKKDVEGFFKSLVEDFDLAFHPDDEFADYVTGDGKQVFNSKESKDLDAIMNQCFLWCEKNNVDIYEVGLDVTKAEYKKRGIEFARGGRTKAGIAADKRIKAKHPGRRVSKSGNVYYENRPNRSDENRSKKFEKGGKISEPELLVSGSYGIYVPQMFSENFNLEDFGFSKKDAEELKEILSNIDHDEYWDAWDDILSHAKTKRGETLYQSDDLWLIPEDFDLEGWDSYARGGRTKAAIAADKRIKAKHPGRRLSKSGNVYYENRPNRSDENRLKKFEEGGRIKQVRVYSFEELSDKAKEKAISEFYDINVSHDWWDFTYDNAKDIGLKITAFDIGRGGYCNGDLMWSAEEVADKIIANHGESTGTYKLAKEYVSDFNKLVEKYSDGDNKTVVAEDKQGDFDDELSDLDEEFKKQLLNEYLSILDKEYEYLTSDEAVTETIIANDYEFTKDGKLFRYQSGGNVSGSDESSRPEKKEFAGWLDDYEGFDEMYLDSIGAHLQFKVSGDSNILMVDGEDMAEMGKYRIERKFYGLTTDDAKKVWDTWKVDLSQIDGIEPIVAVDEDLLEFKIPDWSLSAIVNGDFSGLSDDDEDKLNKFLDRLTEEYGNSNLMLPPNERDLEPHFTWRNDVDGHLGANVITMYLRPSKEYSRGGRTKAAIAADKRIKAKHPGRRVSKDGNVYYENRPNRSDENRSKRFEHGGVAADWNNESKYNDYNLAQDVELFAENDGDLYRQRWVPMITNLKKKRDKKIFDETKAAKMFKYYVDAADKEYQRQVLNKKPAGFVLSVNDRNLLSKKLAHYASIMSDEDMTFERGGRLGFDLDNITKHYMFAALWASYDDEDTPLDENYSVDDISPDLKSAMERNVKSFVESCAPVLKKVDLTEEQIGHSLWLSQNGHGAGFFDYSLDKEDENVLMNAADSLKGMDLYVGDDKLIHGSGYYKDGGLPSMENPDAYASGGVARIANYDAQSHTENRIPFKGNHLEGKVLENGDYVVLSYGYYPIWYYNASENKWYGNSEKYSATTAKHISQSRPSNEATILTNAELLQKMRKEDSYDLGGLMVRQIYPLPTDNTLAAHAGSPLPSQNEI